MTRDVGRAEAAKLRQLADVALTAAQQVDDLQARWVGQRLEIRGVRRLPVTAAQGLFRAWSRSTS